MHFFICVECLQIQHTLNAMNRWMQRRLPRWMSAISAGKFPLYTKLAKLSRIERYFIRAYVAGIDRTILPSDSTRRLSKFGFFSAFCFFVFFVFAGSQNSTKSLQRSLEESIRIEGGEATCSIPNLAILSSHKDGYAIVWRLSLKRVV